LYGEEFFGFWFDGKYWLKNYSLLKDIDFNELKYRGRLRPKSLRGNNFYKGHRDIAKKASNHFKKASSPLKMYLKSLAIF
jgi:hypothetical protein